MELMAAIQGLLAFKEPCEVEITTDAEYVRQGITQWVIRWKRRHWWKKNHPVRNADLWMELDDLVGVHKTTWIWTKGHAAHEDNTRCDWLAQKAARTPRSSPPAGMPPGRSAGPGRTACRMGASGLTWAATTFPRSRRPGCSTLSILETMMKMR